MLIEYLLGTEAAEDAVEIIRHPDADLRVPVLCDVEVVSGLRRAVLSGELSEGRAAEALEDYADLPLGRHGHLKLLGRIFELRANFSAYDAAYVALAERIGAELLTADASLERSVRTHTTVTALS